MLVWLPGFLNALLSDWLPSHPHDTRCHICSGHTRGDTPSPTFWWVLLTHTDSSRSECWGKEGALPPVPSWSHPAVHRGEEPRAATETRLLLVLFLLWDRLASRHLPSHISLCSAFLSLLDLLPRHLPGRWSAFSILPPAHLSVHLQQHLLLSLPSHLFRFPSPRRGRGAALDPDLCLLTPRTCSFSQRLPVSSAARAAGPGRPLPESSSVSAGAADDPAALVSSFLGPRLRAQQVSGANAKPCLSAQPPGPDVSCLVVSFFVMQSPLGCRAGTQQH